MNSCVYAWRFQSVSSYMSKRILIVDDDGEFNNLLTDVFRQAGYEVTTEEHPDEAEEQLNAQHFDLVVTDQRFPQGSGIDLMRRIRKQKPEMPVIMVSGYLDNDTIRDLIREGVRGIFMKPLNIFSLLKKTNEIIEFSQAAGTAGVEPAVGTRNLLSYPCQSRRSREFANRLRDLVDFRRNLTLVGDHGCPFTTVMEDIRIQAAGGETLVVLDPDKVTEADLPASLVSASGSRDGPILLGILEAGRLSGDGTQLLQDLSNHQGIFASFDGAVRMVFCLHRDVDSLYDEGRIDEEFYLFLGSNELRLPSLAEVVEDIPLIAERLLRQLDFKGHIEVSAVNFLCRQPWERNVEEMQSVLRKAAVLAGGGALGVTQIQQAIAGKSGKPSAPSRPVGQLQTFLLQQRAIYEASHRALTGDLAAG